MSMNIKRAGKIDRWIKRQSEKLYFLSTFIWRKTQTNYEWEEEKSEFYKDRRLSPEEKAEVRRVWGNIKVDEKWFVLYNSIKREGNDSFDARYIPLDIQYCFIDGWFDKCHESHTLDDKNLYDLYFHDVNRPKTIVRQIKERLLDENYFSVSIEKAVQLCKQQKSVIVKPALIAAGGRGIEFWDEADGEEALVKLLEKGGNFVVQGIVKQHPALATLHKNSVNTIRLVTCLFDDKMEVITALVRMGVGGTRVDNAFFDGLFCGLNDDGSLKKYAYNRYCTPFENHPQGAVFATCKIPNYERCKELVKNLANRFVNVAKFISWDLAIGEDGEPLLIEMNLSYTGIDILQIANGPLYGDKTNWVIAHALSDKRFRRYERWL